MLGINPLASSPFAGPVACLTLAGRHFTSGVAETGVKENSEVANPVGGVLGGAGSRPASTGQPPEGRDLEGTAVDVEAGE